VLRFEWNALRQGHRVSVHDPASADMALIPGIVVMIDTPVARRGVNGIGIRVADDFGTSRILWPSYLAVHADPIDPTERCWRCQEIAARLPAPRQCGRCRGTFPGDPTLPRGLDLGWWACPPCHEYLIGSGATAVPTWRSTVTTGVR
jgi:hypothetical protein